MPFGEVLLALTPSIAMTVLLVGGWYVWPKDGRPPWRRF